jgi:hypothetical protein
VSQFPDLNAPIPRIGPVPPPPDVPPVEAPGDLQAGYIRLINMALSVLSLRILAIIALLGAVGMFSATVYDPQPWRVYAVAAYSIVVLWPIIYLYIRKE